MKSSHSESRIACNASAATSYRMQALRDNADCAQKSTTTSSTAKTQACTLCLPSTKTTTLPQALRAARKWLSCASRVNGQIEMGAAFDRAGFAAVDAHERYSLLAVSAFKDFRGLVACGGFSYGDVLGAGAGWANPSSLTSAHAPNSKTLLAQTALPWACNGCQMLSNLWELTPARIIGALCAQHL